LGASIRSATFWRIATTKVKQKTKSTSKTVAPVATPIAQAVESQTPLTEHLDLEFSRITDDSGLGDACSPGCLPDLNQYFLLVMDKGIEYFVSFSIKNRASPLALLQQFATLTGRKICYLRIDGAKEFQSEEIKEYCAENDVVLQLVVESNHTMQARVEGTIGCVKLQHSRTFLLYAGKPTRFWDDATKDFSIKKG